MAEARACERISVTAQIARCPRCSGSWTRSCCRATGPRQAALAAPSRLTHLVCPRLGVCLCSAAAQVSISDTTWSPDAFEFVEGQPAATVDSIASGASFTHTFVLKPKLVGALETAAATVSYTPYPDGEVQSGVSTIISGLVVISPLELRVNQAVEFGKYASLGYCQTVRDWVTVFVAVVAITSLFFVNAAVSAGRAASQRRKREAALKELQG